jgi:hypothetical protein
VILEIWSTKYALTKGIVHYQQAEQSREFPTMVGIKGECMDSYLHAGDWHTTRKAAVKKAEEMRLRKIASLRKALAKMERLRFE